MKDFIKSVYHFLNPAFQNLFLEYKVIFKPRYGHGQPPHGLLYEIINQYRFDYSERLKRMLAYKSSFWQIKDQKNESDSMKPMWNNGYLPGLDIVALYSLLVEFKPKKYIEIGSGNSTKVAFKAKQEQTLDFEIISIDPQPRAEMDQLADTIYRLPFEDCAIDLPEMLHENDVLFVDNSHRILPNSDATVFFMEILPRLKKGVVVHIHDIYLPYDYPLFMCERAYSEQYALAAFLMANPQKYRPILPNYFISEDDDLKSILNEIWQHQALKGVETHGGSFWIQIME